ncbi:hypothetical protein [Methylibium sp.]|uniref:hypothetical protein n=1 Tax=Methylibium sp. TaxID=2067992 RepID=UPI0017BBE5C0|nr:hypothetical protein [Methylibium sp.]MBA3590395.1 hypothetical protein [Methylibium sp.]
MSAFSAAPCAAQGRQQDTGDAGLPCAQALIAGTVALMTTWADPCPDCKADVATQRALMARKIVSNLDLLQRHPLLSAPLRQVMSCAHRRWLGLACAAQPDATLSEPAGEAARAPARSPPERAVPAAAGAAPFDFPAAGATGAALH